MYVVRMFGMTGDIIYYIDVYCIDIVQHRNNLCSPQNHGIYGNRIGCFLRFHRRVKMPLCGNSDLKGGEGH
jgi:hypothetical protein